MEDHGFLKYVRSRGNDGEETYKCVNSEEEYKRLPSHLMQTMGVFDKYCSNDPHFYQACDHRISESGEINNSEVLCGLYFCDIGGPVLTSVEFANFIGVCSGSCANTDVNRALAGCSEDEIILPSGSSASSSTICNDVCEVFMCEDEANCGGHLYGMYCPGRGSDNGFLPSLSICDGNSDCDSGEDEANCEVTETTETSCRHYMSNELVPVHNFTKCAPIDRQGFDVPIFYRYSNMIYCILEDVVSFQTNCTDDNRVALTCEINGYMSSVSKYLICFDENISACDDKIDSNCYSTKSCKIHKHLLCDDEVDCNGEADEIHPICMSKMIGTCKRRFGGKSELPIPTSWLGDGVWDCENGADEIDDWPKCGEGKTLRYLSSAERECKNVYLCRDGTGSPGFEMLENLCDGLENCGNENEVCSISSRTESVRTVVSTTDYGLTKRLSFCFKGLRSLEELVSTCVTEKFIYPDEDIYGVDTKTSVILPDITQSCDYMYGEHYLYTSCTGRCKEASCPLRSVTRYEYCPDQFPDRVGTIVNSEYLLFFTRLYGRILTNRYFVCDNKIRCIDYSKVCDLVHDCQDGSDENYCQNHFVCKGSGKLLPKTKECDGVVDCADLSDECNERCPKEILKGTFLKVLSWLIGIVAVLANLVIIGKSLRTLKRCKTSAALINRFLIMIISFGDFLIGCYLLVIATYDTILFKDGYCRRQITWITSIECSAIGAFSTIGSQVSLFSMTGLSIVRIHGIWTSMRIPGEVKWIHILKITATMLCLILAAVAIAIVPVLGRLEDFFVNALKFSDGLKIFVGTPDKEMLLAVAQAYYGRTKKTTLSWKMLVELVEGMFSHDHKYNDLTERFDKVDFYGNDGVCLFKYFVNKHDPQRLFVWSILSLNFVCFIFICLSYILIGVLTRRSSKMLAGKREDRQLAKRNNRINQKIAIIILTDFLCWVPFILICILHTSEVIDATSWYSLFSMVILPINSVINPFLYDDTVVNAVKTPLRSLHRMTSSASVTLNSLRQRFSSQRSEEISLGRISTQPESNITSAASGSGNRQRSERRKN